MTPTSPPYRAPSEWEEAERRNREHDVLHWTACYNDECWTHRSDKDASGWYPKKSTATQSGRGPSPEAPPTIEEIPTRISKNQIRKERHAAKGWKKCYKNGCHAHIQEKLNGGYYPQSDGTRKPLSRWHGFRGKEVVGTRREREGSEKTQPDTDALRRQVEELINERDRTRTEAESAHQRFLEQMRVIENLNTRIEKQGRTIAGASFQLERMRKELGERKAGNDKLEGKNRELRQELRRAGRRLCDLGQ
jgi:hypothetical protein